MVKYRAFKTGSTYKLPSKIIYITSHTFYSTTTWVVPANVTRVRVDCVAAQGYNGGKGGRVLCTLKTTPSETLYITVGKATDSYNASDIRKVSNTLQARVIVAGGGGFGSLAGAGGGTTGGQGSTTGYNSGGGGGTQSAGGFGSYQTGGTYRGGGPGQDGTLGYGGTGWTTGGAGYYGGGGGSAFDIDKIGICYGGSGGGSSYTNTNYCPKDTVSHYQGVNTGDGYITLSILEGDPGYIMQGTAYLAYADS